MLNFFLRAALLLVLTINLFAHPDFEIKNPSAVLNGYFFQNGNINTVFSSDGVFNYDRYNYPGGSAGFIWPVSATRSMTEIFASGIWIGTKLIMANNQREFRLTGAMFNGDFTPGIIPVPGSIPPQSVCSDTLWKGYLVSLTDSTLINGGVRNKTGGGRVYTFNYSPWFSWPVNYGAPYVEVNNIPGYQPGWNSDRPGIGGSSARPLEILFQIFMDYTNCTDSIRPMQLSSTGGTRPIGIELHQLVYMFDHPALNNAYFIKWKLINKSARVMDSTYIGIFNDADIGFSGDDAKGCDSVKAVGIIYNFDDDDEGYYGIAPPAIGFNFLQTPIIRTNLNSDTAKFYCDTLAGYRQIGLTSFSNIRKNGDSCISEPSSAFAAYNFMKGLDGCGQIFYNPITGKPTKYHYSGDACNRIGWVDSFWADKRGLISSGPFVMQPLDTQIIVAAFYTARGSSNLNSVCRLLQYSDDIKALYGLIVCGYPIIGINNNSELVPNGFKLRQNYPNPFNPVTKIKFEISVKSFVRLEIYNTVGQLVELLVNYQLDRGSYEVDWNAGSFATGVYFYVLKAGDKYYNSNKMVLLK